MKSVPFIEKTRKIKSAHVAIVTKQLRKPYILSFATLEKLNSIIVCIERDDGIKGYGEAVALPGYSWETTQEIYSVIKETIDKAHTMP